jgi:putative endonuclease
MKFYVYILKSEYDGSYYVGFSSDLETRIWEHNEGRTGYTSKKRPWKLVYWEEFEGKTEALKREIFIKRKKSKTFIEELIATKPK